jgi:hypothetical protein
MTRLPGYVALNMKDTAEEAYCNRFGSLSSFISAKILGSLLKKTEVVGRISCF